MKNRLFFIFLTVCLFAQLAAAQTNQPKSAREFFNLLPQRYFALEGCYPARDKGCVKARREYLQAYLETEDAANGYMKGGCDGAQSCFEMTLFKRPNGAYIVALATHHEMMDNYYFLEYRSGKWLDVSKQIVPQFSRKNMYELPQFGTTVQVFAKNITESGADYEVGEKGAKLYDLVWKNGRFVIQR